MHEDEYDLDVFLGVRRLTSLVLDSPPRDGDVEVEMPLDPLCESPSNEAEVGPLSDNVDGTMFVPEPDTMSSAVSSVTKPVPVLVSVFVSARVKDDEE